VAADSRIGAVDRALADWRQGDCVLGEYWFVSRIDVAHPLSPAAQAAALQGIDLADDQVRGLVLVTQTCDIMRSCADRPFVEVCPLVEVEEPKLLEIARARRPAYALVPALAPQRLVADLDRSMTLEKPVVAAWSRVPGCRSDREARAFAQALARKRARFAFPDDFSELARGLQTRLVKQHDKATDEGRALQALREIRVQASPAWEAERTELFFWFVRDEQETDFEGKRWDGLLEHWLALVPMSGRFSLAQGRVVTLSDMTGAEYVGSDPLDLDYLSARITSPEPEDS
jgi:hypothetical protein